MSKSWEQLHTTEQLEYFDWIETLQIQGHLPMEMDDDEFMEKCYRMYNCDIRQGFDLDEECLREWFDL